MIYSNFFNRLWYIPESERESVRPASFLLQSPSYRLYQQIGDSEEIAGVISESIDSLLLENCIKDSTNTEGLTSYSQLPLSVQQDILKTLLSLFYPTKEFIRELTFNLDIQLDSRYSNESWNCKICQAKGLDKQRNCPYLDKNEYHDDTFTLEVGNEIYTMCPMDKKDYKLMSVSFEAHRMLDKGIMPENGSYGDQPLLFCILAKAVKDKIDEYEHKQLKEQQAKLK
jgi:hypothetical protein